MKQQNFISTLLSLLTAGVLLASPVLVRADDTGAPVPPLQAPILISEVQAGSAGNASEEFIELYNASGAAIDLAAHGWQLELAGTTATNWSSPLRTIPLSGTIASGQSYVVASQFSSGGQTVQYLSAIAQAWFSAGLSAGAGHLRLAYSTNQLQSDGTCSAGQTVVDEAEWSVPKNGAAATPSLDGRTVFVTTKSTGIPAGNSLQRLVDPTVHSYTDTSSDAVDFGIGTSPTPAGGNTLTAAASLAGSAEVPVPLPADECDPNPPADPPGGDGGSTSPLEPPAGSPPTADPGAGDGSGQNDGQTPTDPSGPTIPAADQGLLAPQISELLPNPAAPQTDAADEFIELYNPNSLAFDLSGFKLVAGTTTTHDYVFPAGTLLAPGSFTAFFSADTGLSLSNSGGQVKLVDPLDAVIAQTDAYAAAKDGQAWIFADGVWQWTSSPTPNAANAVATPIVTASKKAGTAAATAKATTKKSTAAVKSATTKAKSTKSKAKTADTGQTLVADATTSKTPLHPGILAVVGVLAVLYGAYEYRHDMANYFRRLRENRATRRKARQAAARR